MDSFDISKYVLGKLLGLTFSIAGCVLSLNSNDIFSTRDFIPDNFDIIYTNRIIENQTGALIEDVINNIKNHPDQDRLPNNLTLSTKFTCSEQLQIGTYNTNNDLYSYYIPIMGSYSTPVGLIVLYRKVPYDSLYNWISLQPLINVLAEILIKSPFGLSTSEVARA